MSTVTNTAAAPYSLATLLNGMWKENPGLVIALGMCPTIAVTNSFVNALTMGVATLLVLVCSSALVSMLRSFVPNQVRIVTHVVIIAALVTVVDFAIQAISLQVYNALGVFIQLIVVNCIILGHAEGFASNNTVFRSAMNAVSIGLGFVLALLCLGSVREVLGTGQFAGVQVFGERFEPWAVMALPPGGFFVLGGWLLAFSWWNRRSEMKSAGAGQKRAA